jgi:hypothetical protein
VSEAWQKRELRRYEAVLEEAYTRIVQMVDEDVNEHGAAWVQAMAKWPGQTNCSWLMFDAAKLVSMAAPLEAEAGR